MPVEPAQPMTEAMYYILLALLEPGHGYGMMQRIREISHGRMEMGPGTLYGVLNRMKKEGWITLEEQDARRKTYAITDAGKEVLTITENGYGKKTPVEEYRITNRGGLGIKNYMVTEKTGGIVGVKVVDGSEDLLLVTRAGILIRTPVEAIRTTGRATQGVIVMRFKEEGDSVISMALTEHEESEE